MSNVLEIQADQWEKEVLNSNEPVVVDFWHHMCGWCQKLNPVFKQLPEKIKNTKFVKVNVLDSAENRKIAIDLGVLGTPTIKIFCEGRAIGEIVGFRSSENLVIEINNILDKKEECLKSNILER